VDSLLFEVIITRRQWVLKNQLAQMKEERERKGHISQKVVMAYQREELIPDEVVFCGDEICCIYNLREDWIVQ